MSIRIIHSPEIAVPVKALLLDMDGVMFDTERRSINAIMNLVQRQNLSISLDFIYANFGVGPADMKIAYENHLGPRFIWDAFWTTYWKERNDYYNAHGMPVMKGVKDVLTCAMENNIPCILASSSPQKEAIASLKRAEMDSYFYGVIGGDMFVHSKPEPDIYLKAAEMAGVEPENCLVLEDSPNGLRSGTAAKAQTMMIPDVLPFTQTLEPFCNYLCDNMYDVVEFLREHEHWTV